MACSCGETENEPGSELRRGVHPSWVHGRVRPLVVPAALHRPALDTAAEPSGDWGS